MNIIEQQKLNETITTYESYITAIDNDYYYLFKDKITGARNELRFIREFKELPMMTQTVIRFAEKISNELFVDIQKYYNNGIKKNVIDMCTNGKVQELRHTIKFFSLNVDQYGMMDMDRNHYYTLLQIACRLRNLKMVEMLIGAGANPNGISTSAAMANENRSEFFLFSFWNIPPIMLLFKSTLLNPKEDDNALAISQLLIDSDANLDCFDFQDSDKTLIHHAIDIDKVRGSHQFVNFLIFNGIWVPKSENKKPGIKQALAIRAKAEKIISENPFWNQKDPLKSTLKSSLATLISTDILGIIEGYTEKFRYKQQELVRLCYQEEERQKGKVDKSCIIL